MPCGRDADLSSGSLRRPAVDEHPATRTTKTRALNIRMVLFGVLLHKSIRKATVSWRRRSALEEQKVQGSVIFYQPEVKPLSKLQLKRLGWRGRLSGGFDEKGARLLLHMFVAIANKKAGGNQ